ncbi:hypothetical protein [Pseudodonghicola xiamenensis]|uniref:Secreted protein n=1 Tax=Pseudodonghicola xiamenensis TaxID=337702 RepID=A0A8J3MCS6_9RHOB|nr:hypothetical protein [Pseudodonghicola xiamenensis]GHG88176.1 hypothetical protein GCM10010961_17020 [Pseudodonghicola xiamenensis]
MNTRTLFIITAAMVSMTAAQTAFAQEAAQLGAKVDPGTSVTLDKHGVCRVITNNGETPIMVPANLPREWYLGSNSFLKNLSRMDQVSVSSCGFDLNMDSPYTYMCGGTASPAANLACANTLGRLPREAEEAGYYVRGVAVSQIENYGMTFSWFQTPDQNYETLSAVCGNSDLAPEPGVYWTMIWTGDAFDPHMIGAVFECS